MSTITVRYLDGDRFAILTRSNCVSVDQPIEDGGTDTAPTPTELLVGSLASCVAFYARRYLARHHLPSVGLTVSAVYTVASRPARVSDVKVDIELPESVPEERRSALLAVTSHCTVHNTLRDPPDITISLMAGNEAAA